MAVSLHTSIASFLRILSVSLLFAIVQTGPRKGGNKVVLLLLDGMRWDLFGVDMPALKDVERNGVRLDWLDTVFPTLSSPSMFTIATGLYPESHGVIHNLMFTNTTQLTYRFADAFTRPEWWDQPGSDPIWVTAIHQGLKAGSIAYPGAQTPIHDILPTEYVVHDNHFNMTKRIDITMGYLLEDDLDLVFVYNSDPDNTMHGNGIGSDKMLHKMSEINDGIRYLFQKLGANNLLDSVNVLITSDHGMVNMDLRKNINIYSDSLIKERDVRLAVANYGPFFQVEPIPGKLNKVFRGLDSSPLLHVYKRDEMPERFHYGKNSRNLQIIGFADPGWHVITKDNEDQSHANHGYDNELMAMKSILYAQGPSFKTGYRARNMESVNIYPLICELLNITPSANNGSRNNYKDMLVKSLLPTQSVLPSEPKIPPEQVPPTQLKITVRKLTLVVMVLSLVSLLLGVIVIYYCGMYGLCKKGILFCCEQDESRSHTGFISLAVDIDEDDEV